MVHTERLWTVTVRQSNGMRSESAGDGRRARRRLRRRSAGRKQLPPQHHVRWAGSVLRFGGHSRSRRERTRRRRAERTGSWNGMRSVTRLLLPAPAERLRRLVQIVRHLFFFLLRRWKSESSDASLTPINQTVRWPHRRAHKH